MVPIKSEPTAGHLTVIRKPKYIASQTVQISKYFIDK